MFLLSVRKSETGGEKPTVHEKHSQNLKREKKENQLGAEAQEQPHLQGAINSRLGPGSPRHGAGQGRPGLSREHVSGEGPDVSARERAVHAASESLSNQKQQSDTCRSRVRTQGQKGAGRRPACDKGW